MQISLNSSSYKYELNQIYITYTYFCDRLRSTPIQQQSKEAQKDERARNIPT